MSRFTSRFLTFTLGLVLSSVVLGACAASPRQRPVQGAPLTGGPGTLEYTRRQLEGTWTLSKFEVATAAGQLQAVRAKAQLTYDAYGNLTVRGVLEEPLPGQSTITDAPALMYSGKAVIDTARQELQLTGVQTSVSPAPSLQAVVPTSARRKYEVTGNQLTLSIMNDQGSVVSRATFSK